MREGNEDTFRRLKKTRSRKISNWRRIENALGKRLEKSHKMLKPNEEKKEEEK